MYLKSSSIVLVVFFPLQSAMCGGFNQIQSIQSVDWMETRILRAI